jgi:hypothetical protein
MKCSICGIELPLMIQMKLHERWHSRVNLQGGNT